MPDRLFITKKRLKNEKVDIAGIYTDERTSTLSRRNVMAFGSDKKKQ